MHPSIACHLARPRHTALWIAGGGSVLALVLAYISQYGFGLHPCHLCLWQRVPYALVILLTGVLAWRLRRGTFPGWWLIVLMVLFIGDAGIAAYHAGMEWGFWGGASGCSGTLVEGLTQEQILERIMNAPSVSCSEAAFRFLWLSMAGWNVLYAMMLAALTACFLPKTNFHEQ